MEGWFILRTSFHAILTPLQQYESERLSLDIVVLIVVAYIAYNSIKKIITFASKKIK